MPKVNLCALKLELNGNASVFVFSSVMETSSHSNIDSERLLVYQWRFGLEGVLIPCVGLPGVFGILMVIIDSPYFIPCF